MLSGDVLMFLRFLPRVKQRPGDRLVFACQKALQPLLRNLPWVDEWFPIDEVGAIRGPRRDAGPGALAFAAL